MTDCSYSPVSELQRAMARGETTAAELVRFYAARIARYDAGADGLNAVRLLAPDAETQAAALDAERAEGRVRSPLHGIPVLLKDNIDVRGLPTTGGSLALADSRAPRDAELTRRLRAAGAVILGKTNLSEMAHYMGEDTPSGYSAVAGQVRCPYDRAADPSGSSTGSAVAVASGLCPLAVGTETCGSIISPSSVNGVTGLRPSAGLVSRGGILPISSTLDTAGPIARSAEDAALLLAAMAGRDAEDAATADAPDIMALPDGPDSLCGLRIGVSRDYEEEASPERRAAGETVLKALRDAGAALVTLPQVRGGGTIGDVMRYEMRDAVDAYLTRLQAPVRTMAELIAFNAAHADRALRYGQELLVDAQEHGDLRAPEYLEALAVREEAQKRLRAAMDGAEVSVLFSVAPRTLFPFVGFPELTVPAAMNGKMPVGSCFVARPYDDGLLLRVGALVQRLLPPAPRPVL